jgi:hypothetical protein
MLWDFRFSRRLVWRWLFSGLLCRVVCRCLPAFQSCLLPTSLLIALMMEAASTSETLVNFHQTTLRNNLYRITHPLSLYNATTRLIISCASSYLYVNYYYSRCIVLASKLKIHIIIFIGVLWPVKFDGNGPFMCWTLIKFIATLSLQIAMFV